MKKIKVFITLIIMIYGNSAYSSIISANLDYVTPSTLTDQVDLIADFGMTGQNININNLTLTLTFEDNLLEQDSGLGISYLANISNSPPSTAWLAQGFDFIGAPLGQLSFSLNNLYIDNNGLSYLRLGAGGDGVYVSSITLSGDATVVPLPPSFVLLLSGLLTFIGFAKKTANNEINAAQTP